MKHKRDRLESTHNTASYETSRKFTASDDCSHWTVERIKHELELRGYTLASLSRAHGMHDSACRIALRKQWAKVERILAEALDVESPAILFPDRYDEHGIPKKHYNGVGNQNAKRKKGSR